MALKLVIISNPELVLFKLKFFHIFSVECCEFFKKVSKVGDVYHSEESLSCSQDIANVVI